MRRSFQFRNVPKRRMASTRARIGSLVVVFVAVAALAAPVALADKWGTARTSGSGGSATLRPDDRSGLRGNGPILVAAPVAKTVTVQIKDAFQWGDAGIGAGVVFVGMMLAGGIVFMARRHSVGPAAA